MQDLQTVVHVIDCIQKEYIYTKDDSICIMNSSATTGQIK